MEKKQGLFDWYLKTNLLLKISLGLFFGAFAGLFLKEQILWVQPLGEIFVRLLKMIVMPVVLTTLVVGAASISPSEIGKVGIKIMFFYLITSAVAVIFGLFMGNIFQPGMGLDLGDVSGIAGKAAEQPNVIQTLLNIIPTNPFASLSEGNVLPLIFFAIIFGIGVSTLRASGNQNLKSSGDIVFRFFDGAAEVMYLMVRWILQYAPVGVFALIAVVFARQGSKALGPLGTVTAAVFLGFVAQFLLYGLLLAMNRLSYMTFLRGTKEALITAFVTRSSSGTLPLTMNCAENELGVSRNVSSFTLPLGATINMDGNAIYQGVCALFIAFAVGMPLSIQQQITVVITAVLASIGAAGVPGAGVIMLLLVLDSVGLKVEEGSAVAAAYAMILGIDAILDMGRTATNVAGDLVGTVLVAKSEGLLSLEKWGISRKEP